MTWRGDGNVTEAIRANADLIAGEVLAVSLAEGRPGEGAVADRDLGLEFAISKA